jgi:hypothetical protein
MKLANFLKQGGVQRNLIISFILVGLIPMAIMGAIFYYQSSSTLKESANNEMTNVSAKVLEQLDQDFMVYKMQMHELRRPLQGGPVDAGVQPGDRRGQQRKHPCLFPGLHEDHPIFKQVRFVDKDGTRSSTWIRPSSQDQAGGR